MKRAFLLLMIMVMISTMMACGSANEPKAYKATTIIGTWMWDAESDNLWIASNEEFKFKPETIDASLADVVDLYWEQVSVTERYLIPWNGAKAKLIQDGDFDSIDAAFIKNQNLSTEKISGSDEGVQLNPGTIVVFETAEGNFGKFQVEQYVSTYDITFPEAEKHYTTYWKEATRKNWNNVVAVGQDIIEKYHLRVKWELFK